MQTHKLVEEEFRFLNLYSESQHSDSTCYKFLFQLKHIHDSLDVIQFKLVGCFEAHRCDHSGIYSFLVCALPSFS